MRPEKHHKSVYGGQHSNWRLSATHLGIKIQNGSHQNGGHGEKPQLAYTPKGRKQIYQKVSGKNIKISFPVDPQLP